MNKIFEKRASSRRVKLSNNRIPFWRWRRALREMETAIEHRRNTIARLDSAEENLVIAWRTIERERIIAWLRSDDAKRLARDAQKLADAIETRVSFPEQGLINSLPPLTKKTR